eukprot:365205-Chlamydomonas_euryale.AAC.7
MPQPAYACHATRLWHTPVGLPPFHSQSGVKIVFVRCDGDHGQRHGKSQLQEKEDIQILTI